MSPSTRSRHRAWRWSGGACTASISTTAARADGDGPLIDALAALYAYVFGVEQAAVRRAGEQRAEAMRYSDRWVREGCSMASPLIEQERAALIRSYAALLAAVHRP